MKKLLIAIFIIFLFCNIGFSQEWINFYDSKINPNKPFLISKISSGNEGGGEQLFHTLEQAYEAFRNDSEFSLALRVCSSYPSPIVFTDSKYSPLSTRNIIETRFSLEAGGTIKLERVFLLRNDKNCVYNQKYITEYWLVPKDSDFPEFVEIGKITDYRLFTAETLGKYVRKSLIDGFKVNEEIISSKSFVKPVSSEDSDKFVLLTPTNYSVFKNNLLKSLRKDKFSFVLIEYPNYGKTRKVIFSQAAQLKQFLIKNNIRQKRIVIKPCNESECDFDFTSKYSMYPNVISIYQN